MVGRPSSGKSIESTKEYAGNNTKAYHDICITRVDIELQLLSHSFLPHFNQYSFMIMYDS